MPDGAGFVAPASPAAGEMPDGAALIRPTTDSPGSDTTWRCAYQADGHASPVYKTALPLSKTDNQN
jgi:hypothetical protein